MEQFKEKPSKEVSMNHVKWRLGRENRPIADRPWKISVPSRNTEHLVCWRHGNQVISEKDTAPGERRGVIILTLAPCKDCEEERRLQREALQAVKAALPGAWIEGESVKWRIPRFPKGEGIFTFTPYFGEDPETAVKRALEEDRKYRESVEKEFEIQRKSIELFHAAEKVELPPEPKMPSLPRIEVPEKPNPYKKIRVPVKDYSGLYYVEEFELLLDAERECICWPCTVEEEFISHDEMVAGRCPVTYYVPLDEYPPDFPNQRIRRLALKAYEKNKEFVDEELRKHIESYRAILKERERALEERRRIDEEREAAYKRWKEWWNGLSDVQKIAYRISKNWCDEHNVRGNVCWFNETPCVKEFGHHIPLARLLK